MDYVIVLREDEPKPEEGYDIRVMSPSGNLYFVNEEGARELLSKGWSIYLGSPVTDESPH